MISIGENYRELTSISISHSANIPESGIIGLCAYCPALQSLKALECPGLADDAVASIARNCPELVTIAFSSRNISNEVCISDLVEGLPLLRDVDVHAEFGASRVLGNYSVTRIGFNCNQLTAIDISKCSMVTDEGATALAEGCPSQQILKMLAYALVSDDRDRSPHIHQYQSPQFDNRCWSYCGNSKVSFTSLRKHFIVRLSQ